MRDDHLDGEGRELEVVVDQNSPEDEDHYQTPKLSRCNNGTVFYNLNQGLCAYYVITNGGVSPNDYNMINCWRSVPLHNDTAVN